MDWQGIQHARMTASMDKLSPTAYKVLGALRRLLKDGKPRQISYKKIMETADIKSKSTIKAALEELDGLFIAREYLGTGRGKGYLTTLLPPPEIRRRTRGRYAGKGSAATIETASEEGSLSEPSSDSTPEKGSIDEPSDRTFFHGVTTPNSAQQEGSINEPSNSNMHEHKQQQQHAPALRETAEPAATLAPETLAALQQLNADQEIVRQITRNFPDLTPRIIQTSLANARKRPDIQSPVGLTLSALAQGTTVTPERSTSEQSVPAARSTSTNRRHKQPDWPDIPMPDLPDPDTEPEPDSLLAQARQVADDLNPLELNHILRDLDQGYTVDEAREAHLKRRQDFEAMMRVSKPRSI
jgi:hypothetical protein